MNTEQAAKPSTYLLSVYRAFSIAFFFIAVLTLFVSLYDFAKELQQQAVLFGSYALLGFLFSFGLWGYKKWIVALFGINALGIVFLKLFWLSQGAGTWTNIVSSIGVATLFAIVTYVNRHTLRGISVEPAILTTFVLCWIFIIENSAIR